MSDSSDYRRVNYFIRNYKKKELREKRRNEYEQATPCLLLLEAGLQTVCLEPEML